MDETIDRTMCRVITAMYERLGDEITMDDLARTAMYSKFHFSRMFRRATGVSPGRFLSAVRFQQAKWLLDTTTLSVAEISNLVGYSSLGTFSTRFKKCVGVTPTEYRQGGRPADRPPRPTATGASVSGLIRVAGGGECRLAFVGLFPDPVPHGAPVSRTVLSRPGHYLLDGVPDGTWYVVAHGVLRDGSAAGADPAEQRIGLVGRLGPVSVRGGSGVTAVDDVLLRPMRAMDLPVLPAPFTTHPTDVARPATTAHIARHRIHPLTAAVAREHVPQGGRRLSINERRH